MAHAHQDLRFVLGCDRCAVVTCYAAAHRKATSHVLSPARTPGRCSSLSHSGCAGPSPICQSWRLVTVFEPASHFRRSEYSGSFDSGRSALRLYVRAAELARTLNDECQLAMDKEYETIDLLKSRLLVRPSAAQVQ